MSVFWVRFLVFVAKIGGNMGVFAPTITRCTEKRRFFAVEGDRWRGPPGGHRQPRAAFSVHGL